MTALPRRILFVTESIGVGGTETHLLDLLPALKDRGFEVGAFCFTETGSRAARLEDSGIRVEAAPQIGGTAKRSWKAPFRMLGGVGRLYRHIRRARPSIVHFFLPAPYLLGAPPALLAGVPIKVMSRRSLNDYQRKWPGSAMAESFLHGQMNALLANAKALTAELVAEGGDPRKVHLIYNGVAPPELPTTKEEARSALGLPQDAFIATTVATLFPYKGHLDLIEALSMAGDRLPRPWYLLLAGRDGGSCGDVRSLIEAKGLSKNVQLLGERSDIAQLLAASDVSLLTPTRNEGFSNSVLESMAAGLPVIVTDVGGNAEAVSDRKTGYVVPPGDPSAIAEALLTLGGDRDTRHAMGLASRDRALTDFSLRRSVDNYCALYEELLATRASDR